MIKVFSVVGARPQFIKAAAICRAIRSNFDSQIKHLILHTGQHYDANMSDVFFEEMQIDKPAYNLDFHTKNQFPMAEAVYGIKEIFKKEKPDFVIVYGDTYSTLAGAKAAGELHIPIAHVEAGLRSFDLSMPEEHNRMETDKLSELLFTPTQTGYKNLINEKLDTNKKIYHCGDVMYDNTLFYKEKAKKPTFISDEISNYILVTIHRQSNTTSKERLTKIVEGLTRIANKEKKHIILPLHPRTQKAISELTDDNKNILTNQYLHITKPVSFFEMMYLEKNADIIITDSGGVQKEAFFFQKPCIILRSQTEWTELVDLKWGILTDAIPEKIEEAYHYFKGNLPQDFPPVFGDGRAAIFICQKIIEYLKDNNV